MINSSISVEKILTSFENLSQEEKTLLYEKIQQTSSEKTTDSENPWIKLAGKYENDPQYDEVLEYIKQYRCEIDAENEEEGK